MSDLGPIGQTITAKLNKALEPSLLEVVDESHRHAGHAGARPEGETHFRIKIRAAGFAGKTRLDRHRMVNAVLADELKGPIHALSLDADQA